MAKPTRRSLAKHLGRNIGARRRAVGLTQEQLAELLEVDTFTVSRYETGTILPPLTVVDAVAQQLRTTAAALLSETKTQPVEHAERIGVLLSQLSNADRDWIERVVKLLAEHCQTRRKKTLGQ
ncbi:MAG TPA: helix-turn-helix transcriptional regulator [Burkholderiaceae bacterium]|nr:helix-turn-helix transcriptional regulator [Burkholderiaceae bacterium]